jgi:hypothetical protein
LIPQQAIIGPASRRRQPAGASVALLDDSSPPIQTKGEQNRRADPPRREDPVLRSTRREALIVFVTWIIAMAYTVGYCARYGYPSGPTLIPPGEA